MFREDFHTLILYIIADEAEAENEEQANSIGVLSLNSALSILFFHECFSFICNDIKDKSVKIFPEHIDL
jgi:hypothetical protein